MHAQVAHFSFASQLDSGAFDSASPCRAVARPRLDQANRHIIGGRLRAAGLSQRPPAARSRRSPTNGSSKVEAKQNAIFVTPARYGLVCSARVFTVCRSARPVVWSRGSEETRGAAMDGRHGGRTWATSKSFGLGRWGDKGGEKNKVSKKLSKKQGAGSARRRSARRRQGSTQPGHAESMLIVAKWKKGAAVK